jgi:hypothetical protein
MSIICHVFSLETIKLFAREINYLKHELYCYREIYCSRVDNVYKASTMLFFQ